MRPSNLINLKPVFFLIVLSAASVSPVRAQGSRRVEQDDPSIAYSGNWYSNSTSAHSSGVAALTNARGARATIAFTGAGITWIGVLDGWAGLANVYLDGRLQVVDSYSAITRYRQPVYTVRGLAAGPHALSIEVTHERDGNTQGSWVWIDAFDIDNGEPVAGGITAGAGRVEESNPALLFTGKWFPNQSSVLSGGGAVLATDANSRATIAFNGTGVAWVAYRDEWSGVARVYVDGELKTTIDCYLSPAQTGTVPYRIDGLPFGTHTLTLEATGTRNTSAKGAWIWVDAFDVVP